MVQEQCELKLWILTYDLVSVGKGTAVVKASNAKEAENLLKSSGLYNGTPDTYSINRIEEIIVPPSKDLIAEQNVDCFNNNY